MQRHGWFGCQGSGLAVSLSMVHGFTKVVLAWALLWMVAWPCPPVEAATVFVAGQVVRLECSRNPFNPSQVAQAKIYDSPSAFGRVVLQGCGNSLKVQSASGGWVQVEDMAGKISGYVSENDLALLQEAPRGQPASPAPPTPVEVSPSQTSGATAPAPPPTPAQWNAPSTSQPNGKSEATPTATPTSTPDSPGAAHGNWNAPATQEESEGTKMRAIPSPTPPSRPQESNATRVAPKPKPQHSDDNVGQQPHRCSALYLKMSTGRVLTREESEYLRRHCN